MNPVETLRAELLRAAPSLPVAWVDACCRHFALLLRWNQTHNLTRITDPTEAAHKHYLDCLLPLQQLTPPGVVTDIGSGPGFPGLLAAVVWPSAVVQVLDIVPKKASFLTLAAGELGLHEVVVNPPLPSGDLLVCRATFSAGERHPFWEAAARHQRLGIWTSTQEATSWREQAESHGFTLGEPFAYAVVGGDERVLVRAHR